MLSAAKPTPASRLPVFVVPLLAGLAVRAVVAFGLLRGLPLVNDALQYSDQAKEFLGSFPGKAAYYWPPGSSLLLACAYAVLGSSEAVAKGVMVLLGTAAVPLTARIAREVDPRSEAAAAWIAALYPPAVMLVAESSAQHLAALCILAFAWLGLRAIRERKAALFALAGLALGAGCLTRPSMASLAPVLFGFFAATAWRARKERFAMAKLAAGGAALVLGASVLVVPVVLHNARLGAGFTISTNNERNLFLGNNPYTPDYKTSHLGQRGHEELDPETRAYLESFHDTAARVPAIESRPEVRAAMLHEALSYMASHPGRTALRTLNRTTSFWGFDYMASRLVQDNRGWGTMGLLPLLALEAGGYLVVAALAILGLFAFGAECDRWWLAWLAWLVVAYQVPYAIAFSSGTYHFPAMALLVPFAGVALARRREIALRLRENKAALVAFAVFAIVQVQYAYYAAVYASPL